LFAAAWLERWLVHGGSVMAKPDGSGSMFIPVSSRDVPGYQEPPENWTDEQRDARREVDDWMLCGRTRELMDLLEIVPGGREAVKAHVRAFPSTVYQSGTAVLS
jgi:hypothetical protein